ncbi:MAG TPA: ornithine carbamoyltransferase [Candidatus Atribacteria bacterium]|uniref:Ornithine carbamoyltransferase n=1 Tax=candidate division TA06 bacterium 34_109 TaxID=1635277 RepID=A0A101I0N4_UNCT6|nr:MAG: Ornithine carbamoyltransferase [candidate division TA06 bacterium 34_109]HBY58024.1 ornithine carbamoyltransferase [Candidatus Atribacteria bacterium]
MYSNLKNKSLLCTQDWTVEEIEQLLSIAERLKQDRRLGIPQYDILRGKTFFMLFFEESTRTRNAFEAGITQLGGHAHYLTPSGTQIEHGETAKETSNVLSRYGEGIGIRKTFGRGTEYMREIAKYSSIPVINMQCDEYHPTQALADLLTIKEKFNHDLKGKKFVVSWTYGPNYIRPLSMPQSLILLMPRFGMNVTLAHPKEFYLRPEIVEQAKENAKKAGIKFEILHDMEEAFQDADIVYPKSWGPIMYTEDEKEGLALIDKYPEWVVTQEKMNLTKEHSIYMHCMPADRDIEVTSEVLDGPHSVIIDEAENRLHINKAIMAATMAS